MSEQVLVKTFDASASVEKKRFVSIDSNGSVAPSASNSKVLGVNCSTKVSDGERIEVGVLGIFEVEAASAIAAGATLAAAADGKAKTHTASAQKAGIALCASYADGDLIRALLLH